MCIIIMGDDVKDTKLNERVAIVETEVNVIKDDITEIKTDLSVLKNNQAEANLSIKELTVILSKNSELHTTILEQNSKIMAESNKVMSDMTKRIEDIQEKNDNRYIELIKENNKQEVEIKTKPDSFKDYLVNIGKELLKYAIIGGVLIYILYTLKLIK